MMAEEQSVFQAAMDNVIKEAGDLDERRQQQIERQKWRLTVLMDFLEAQGLLTEFTEWEAKRNDTT